MKMISCVKCNESIPEDSEFCPFCGSKVDRQSLNSNILRTTEIPLPLDPTNIEAVLKRAFIFIEDGLYDRADKYLEIVLDQEPENAEAYLGKLMSEIRVGTKEDLKNAREPFDYNNNYKKVIRYGDENLKSFLIECIEHINNRNEHEHILAEKTRLINTYAKAVEIMTCAESEKEYKDAITLFESIKGYENSEQFINDCLELAKQAKIKDTYLQAVKIMDTAKGPIAYNKAAKLFESIKDYNNSEKLSQQCLDRAYIANESMKTQERKTIVISIVCGAVIFVLILLNVFVIVPYGGYLFGNYSAYINMYKITEFEVPKGVTEIKDGAFNGCENLKTVKIHNGVTSIGDEAFKNCKNLESVTIPDSVTSIGNYAFENCTSMGYAVISKNTKKFGNYIFRNCTNLETIYYTGTEDKWSKVTFLSLSFIDVDANIIYNYVPEE